MKTQKGYYIMVLAMIVGDDAIEPRTWAAYQAKHPKLQRLEPVLLAATDEPNPIAVTTATMLKLPEAPTLSIRGLGAEWERRSKEEREEEAARRDALALSRVQPPRRAYRLMASDRERGYDDVALGTPLGLFCLLQRLRGECYQAGDQYAEVLRQAKAARGFSVPYSPRGEGATGLTEGQLQAMRDAAIIREANCNAILIAIHARAARVLEALCYDQREISVHDEALAAHGLLMLAREAFGLINEGINRGKA